MANLDDRALDRANPYARAPGDQADLGCDIQSFALKAGHTHGAEVRERLALHEQAYNNNLLKIKHAVEKLELHVFPHNVVAIGLYERVGYVREGLRHRHFHRRGEYVDAILMAKDVRAAPDAAAPR